MNIGKEKTLRLALSRLSKAEEEDEEISSLVNDFLGIEEEEVSAQGEGGFPSYGDFLLSFFEGEFPRYVKRKLNEGIKEFDPHALLEENPYWKLLEGLDIKENGLSLGMKTVLPHCLFPLESSHSKGAPRFEEVNGLAYSKSPFSYPEFKQDGRPWMSLVPHEIMTMQEAIKKARGKVLTYGLGMGYFAFMASEKEGVESVTVLEKDPKVISFFKAHLLPLFPKKGKIALIEGDAFADWSEEKEGHYDYLFADIYHDAEDGLPLYIRLKQREGLAKESAYWIEEDILIYLRRYLIAFLEEQSEEEIAAKKEKAYPKGEGFGDALFRSLYLATENKSIQKVDELSEFLSDENLKKLVLSLRFD